MIAELIILVGLLLLEPVLATYRYAVRKDLSSAATLLLTMVASFLYGLGIALIIGVASSRFVEVSFQQFFLGGGIIGAVFALICAYAFLIKALRNRARRKGDAS